MAERRRCAIYTRKSSDEGLDQSFNSLHAQREACEAYVLSQAGEGWSAIATIYDDGGFSGGSMDRPALRTLLDDIDRGLIDIVVVYKVDRLTRSLTDFARIVERFDAKGVSFVSVTQAFNTTSSMGRLTLNVLLSFAQFEREVTAERIRDKIAASKAKGMWMGGRLPLGYEVADHRLVVNPTEAVTVRGIFRRYLELRTVRALQPALEAEGVRSKVCRREGRQQTGGEVFSRGALYYLLSNPVYRGAIRHKEKVYDNAHPPVVDEDVWIQVQHQLKAGGVERSTAVLHGAPVLLQGRVFDDRGNPMVATHTSQGAKRYRYYVSLPLQQGRPDEGGSVPRVAMAILDQAVTGSLEPYLDSHWMRDSPPHERIREAVSKVVLAEDHLHIDTDPAAVARDLDGCPFSFEISTDVVTFNVPLRLRRRQGAIVLQAQGAIAGEHRVDRALVRAVVLARRWARQLEEGRLGSVKEIARRYGLCEHYTGRLMPLAYLAPELTAAILEGRQPASLSLKVLTAQALPLAWADQKRLFHA